jgi:hypothetical protein
VLRMVPGRVSFWGSRPPKNGPIFRPRLSASLLRNQTRDVKWARFWGQKTVSFFDPTNKENGSTKPQNITILRFSFVVPIDTVTLKQRAKCPASQTQHMSFFRRSELPETNRHLCLGVPTHDVRQARRSRLCGSRN